MKTAVTIPWAAVVDAVEGREPADASSPRLPLDVAAGFVRRRGGAFADRVVSLVADAFTCEAAREAASGGGLLAVARRRAAASPVVELVFPGPALTAVVTGNGNSRAVVQDAWNAPVAPANYPHLRRDETIRTYVARHARFVADERAFVIPEDERPVSFLQPTSWGFSRPAQGPWHWTATDMFVHPSHPPTCGPRTRSPIFDARFHDPLFDVSTTRPGDPFHCLPQLRQLLAAVASVDVPTTDLARQLALTLGRCRLFGVAVPPGLDFTLSPKGFDLASRGLLDDLRLKLSPITGLKRPGVDEGPYRDDAIACELLELRTDVHATYLALDEAHAAAVHSNSPATGFMSRRLNQVGRLIRLFDGKLQENPTLVAPAAASTFLMENWRRLLAPALRDCPPWWMDTTLAG